MMKQWWKKIQPTTSWKCIRIIIFCSKKRQSEQKWRKQRFRPLWCKQSARMNSQFFNKFFPPCNLSLWFFRFQEKKRLFQLQEIFRWYFYTFLVIGFSSFFCGTNQANRIQCTNKNKHLRTINTLRRLDWFWNGKSIPFNNSTSNNSLTRRTFLFGFHSPFKTSSHPFIQIRFDWTVVTACFSHS